MYSYSVSFAVALASRPIAGIGRIWADGKLIRDLDGIFKVPTTFRWYDGSEGQAIDPLIGSIEGIASTPAYRGLALAVFEGLELVEFGNRIPFLTFEILADQDPPSVGAIVNDASKGLTACDDPRTVIGYAAHGRSIKAAIEPLIATLAVPLLDDGSKLRTPPGETVPVESDRNLGASADEPAERYQRTRIPASQLPTTVRLTYYARRETISSGKRERRSATRARRSSSASFRPSSRPGMRNRSHRRPWRGRGRNATSSSCGFRRAAWRFTRAHASSCRSFPRAGLSKG